MRFLLLLVSPESNGERERERGRCYNALSLSERTHSFVRSFEQSVGLNSFDWKGDEEDDRIKFTSLRARLVKVADRQLPHHRHHHHQTTPAAAVVRYCRGDSLVKWMVGARVTVRCVVRGTSGCQMLLHFLGGKKGEEGNKEEVGTWHFYFALFFSHH